MPAGLGDLIQITDNQTYLSQDLMNVYYYRVTNILGLGAGYLEAIQDWFQDNIVEFVALIQNDGLIHTTTRAINLSNNLDFYEEVVNYPGQEAATSAEESPSYLTVGFKLIRETLATRNGSKRYSGLTDAKVAGNVYNINTGSSDAIEDKLALDIVIGGVTVAEPVIVGRPINPPVGTSYTYASIGAAVYTGMGTQNTRKP